MATALEKIRALYCELSLNDQASMISDLLEGGGHFGRTDDFIDAILPLERALTDQVWQDIEAACDGVAGYDADDEGDYRYEQWRDRQMDELFEAVRSSRSAAA